MKKTLALAVLTQALTGCLAPEDDWLERQDEPADDYAPPLEAEELAEAGDLGQEVRGFEGEVLASDAGDAPLARALSAATGQPAFYIDSFVAADGTGRYVERHGDASIGLRMDVNYDRECDGPGVVGGMADGFWEESWVQSDPLLVSSSYTDYCGPVAARNLLDWYGHCVDFTTLGAELLQAAAEMAADRIGNRGRFGSDGGGFGHGVNILEIVLASWSIVCSICCT